MSNGFQDLLKNIATRFATKKALADAIGIDHTRLIRAINKGDYPFSVVNCLRLARVSGESPSRVLRLANKGEVADLIDELYGPEKAIVDSMQAELINRWKQLAPDDRKFVWLTIEWASTGRIAAGRGDFGAVDWNRQTNADNNFTGSDGSQNMSLRGTETRSDNAPFPMTKAPHADPLSPEAIEHDRARVDPEQIAYAAGRAAGAARRAQPSRESVTDRRVARPRKRAGR